MVAQVHNQITEQNIDAVNGLLQSLVPLAKRFCCYDLAKSCVWSSDGADDHEIDEFLADLPEDITAATDSDTGMLSCTLNSGRTILGLPVTGGDGESLGILITVFSNDSGNSSPFDSRQLQVNLLPAVRVIGEVLYLNRRLEVAEQQADIADKELALLYQVDQKIHGPSRRNSGLAQLIGQSGRFLNIAYSVLLLPSKRIRISATHSSWKSVNRKALDKELVESLYDRLDGQQSPVIIDYPAVAGAEHPSDLGYQAMLCPLFDQSGNIEGVLAQLGRVNNKPFNQSHLRFMSHIVRKIEYVIEQSFDVMTGLMNRAGFEEQLQESGKALINADDVHQIIYCDLDNLQLVNDTFGRDAGDEVIVGFSQLIEGVLPKNAIATRLTGDDFVILLMHSSVDAARKLIALIRKNDKELRYLHGDKSLQVTVSIGIAEFSRDMPGGKALTAARLACDSAKDHGRDRVEIYDGKDHTFIRRYDDMHLVSQIQKTLDSGGFRMHAQPIVSLTDEDQKLRFEILLRMKDSQGNRVASDAFFSAAERYQLMPQIDRWVISNSLALLSQHVDHLNKHGTIFAINLSGQSLGDKDILRFIEEEIETSGVPSKSLCFEVTESAAISNRENAQELIDALRNRGCRFSLDDFGAGLSSFAYLKNFKIDTLKIDGSFIRDIADNKISESMVAAITQVARVMELDTVAEYVENIEAKELITKLGVDFAQGHAVGRPTPIEEILAGMNK